MGFHVHVDVSSHSVPQLVKICQNFIKSEKVMDTFVPPPRQTGASRFCQSNRGCVLRSIRTSNSSKVNKLCHDRLRSCGTRLQLAKVMNVDSSFYKLNLQNLKLGRPPTVEFRQHSATHNWRKVDTWVRFCVAFCTNSAKLSSPSPFKAGLPVDKQFDCLFWYVIKDRALRDFYRNRQEWRRFLQADLNAQEVVPNS